MSAITKTTDIPSWMHKTFYKPPPDSVIRKFIRDNEHNITQDTLSQLKTLCDDRDNKLTNTQELGRLFWFLNKLVYKLFPKLKEEYMSYRNAKNELAKLERLPRPHTEQVAQQINEMIITCSLNSTTQSYDAEYEYNTLARFCLSMNDLVIRSFPEKEGYTDPESHKRIMKDTEDLLYEFGKTRDAAYGCDLTAYDKFLLRFGRMLQWFP